MQNIFSFSENYYLRKCFLERDQVPTQSLIKKKMSPALANIYFNSMTPKLKIVAGLEPPLKGGGENWYIPPKELLEEGRAVLKPLDKKYMRKWNCYGMDDIGMKRIDVYRRQMKAERKNIAYERDIAWSHKLETIVRQHEEDCSEAAAKANTEFIKHAYREFDCIYTRSITKFQDLLFSAAINKIKKYREYTFQKTQKRYEHLLHQQANMLYDRYTKRLDKTKEALKQQLIKDLETKRSNFTNNLHDIDLEKHIAVEKLRHYLECQTLACQAYVAFKERSECTKEIEYLEHKQRKKLRILTDAIQYADFKIRLAKEKEKRRIELDEMWKRKACLVVEALQLFVSYSLKEAPAQADFFINLEKLMMMQVNAAVENPNFDSVIIQDEEYTPPKTKLRPFYLFCNKGSQASVDSALCPKHVSSSASHMPVIVVNKRCIYSACDNFELFPDHIKDYVFDEDSVDANLEDDQDYSTKLNVTYTASQQLRELKLESSIMQILQQEKANINNVPIMCHGCRTVHCFSCIDCPYSYKRIFMTPENVATPEAAAKIRTPPGEIITSRADEFRFQREPKWDSYIKYIEPRKCNCHKLAKNLRQSLPVYMRKTSEFESPTMNNYEICSVATLKNLVRNAKRGRKYMTPVDTPDVERVKDEGTQYSDIEYEDLCHCFAEKCFEHHQGEDFNFLRERLISPKSEDRQPSISYMAKNEASFVAARTRSLQHLIGGSEVREIFHNIHCTS